MNDDIRQLITACLENDNASWNLLCQTCTAVAANIHRRHYTSLSSNDSENIISNIYTKLFDGGLKSFSGVSKYELLGYIKTITRNETISFLREHVKRNRETSIDHGYENEDGQEESSLLNFLEDNSLRPDIIAEINDLYRNAMAQLSIRDKQILLFKIEGLKDKEISDRLDIPMGTVAVSYNRIKALLQQTLMTALLIILSGRKLPWLTS